jgi:hypothetical protein
MHPPAKSTKAGVVVNIPPQLMKIVQNAVVSETDEAVCGDITSAVASIKSKGVKQLDSYIHAICMRLM